MVWEALLILVLPGPPTLGRDGSSIVVVDNRNEIRQFLASRRARITPEQAGLPTYGGNRRVAGLRREEVALLAGVSVDYYIRLERGNLGGVSEAVLDTLAEALQLDEAERGHLFDLARAANATARPRRRPAPSGSGRASSASWTRWMCRRTCAMAAGTSWPPTASVMSSTPSCTSIRSGRPTWPALCSSAPGPVSSFPTGRVRPATWWPICAPRPAAIPMTGAAGSGRGVVHPQPGVPQPVGGPQRAPAPDRPQAAASPGRRGPGADL
jgi:hypothetical protein